MTSNLTREEKVKRIEALGGKYAEEMEPQFGIDDQLLACEALAESTPIIQKKGGNMTDNDWEKIDADAGETWDFGTQPEIQGVLIRKEEHVGPNDSNMYRLQLADGKELGVWGNTVLDGRFQKVTIGEEVKLVYLGKQKSEKTGREFHAFDVFHRALPMKKVE